MVPTHIYYYHHQAENWPKTQQIKHCSNQNHHNCNVHIIKHQSMFHSIVQWCLSKNNTKTCYLATLKEATTPYFSGCSSLQKIVNNLNEKIQSPPGSSTQPNVLSNYTKKSPFHHFTIEERTKAFSFSKLPWTSPISCIHVSTIWCEECEPKSLKSIIGAATTNTPLNDELSLVYIYKQLQSCFPEAMKQSKAVQGKDRWMNGTTYTNLNWWFDESKTSLIEYGCAIDKPQHVGNNWVHWYQTLIYHDYIFGKLWDDSGGVGVSKSDGPMTAPMMLKNQKNPTKSSFEISPLFPHRDL